MIPISDEVQTMFEEYMDYYQQINIPSRADRIYSHIELLKDENLSHGVAYYMAIRHPDASALLNRVVELTFFSFPEEPVDFEDILDKYCEILDYLEEERIGAEKGFEIHKKITAHNVSLNIPQEYTEITKTLLYKYGLDKKCISYYSDVIFPDKFHSAKIGEDNQDEHLRKKSQLLSQRKSMSEIFENTDEIKSVYVGNDQKYMRKLGSLLAEDFSIKHYIRKLVIYYYTRAKRLFKDKNGDYVLTKNGNKVYINTLNNLSECKALDSDCWQGLQDEIFAKNFIPKAQLLTEVPMLSLPNSNIVSIDINLSLPAAELCAYINGLKKAIKGNSLPSPIHFLCDTTECSNSNTSRNNTPKKNLADKFFVYDYVTAKLLLASNSEKEQLKNEYEINIKDLDNTLYSDERKRKLKRELREEYENELTEIKKYETSVVELFKDEDLLSQIGSKSASTARDYYYSIKPYIEEMKYKTLVTGNIK